MKSKTDIAGRAYAQLSKVKVGDVLEADGDFTCIKAGARLTVVADEAGELGVTCDEGRHHLDGQLDEDGDTLIGLYPAAVA